MTFTENTMTTRERYEQALNTLHEAQQAVLDLQKAYQTELSQDYPLSSMIGKLAYYHRFKWGSFEDAYKTIHLDNEDAQGYQYLKAHLVMKGSQVNKMLDTFRFTDNKNYLFYVVYDEYIEIEDMQRPLDEWPLYEILIVEI